jgi:hypothetical protein
VVVGIEGVPLDRDAIDDLNSVETPTPAPSR